METHAHIPHPRAEAAYPPQAAPDRNTQHTHCAVTGQGPARPADPRTATADATSPVPDEETGGPDRSWRIHVVMLTLSTATVITAATLPWA
ncbi:hypothetical protein ABZX75_28785 [Streptomyces sp. NPDC003038]|uniref:hypothetical protein n=1 Tax=unclassified Streptomyces TaxID=2593676 RepID=UPI0033A8243B